MTTFSIFATFPAHYYGQNMLEPLFDQIVGTFFLLLFLLAITDSMNVGVKADLAPFMVGMAVAAIGMSFGTGAGYAINPARVFGPRHRMGRQRVPRTARLLVGAHQRASYRRSSGGGALQVVHCRYFSGHGRFRSCG
jgi:hypothetical protein